MFRLVFHSLPFKGAHCGEAAGYWQQMLCGMCKVVILISYGFKYFKVFPCFGAFYVFNMLFSSRLFRTLLFFTLTMEGRLGSKQLRVEA